MYWAPCAAVLVYWTVIFLNFYPMQYKEGVMSEKSGNLRANMPPPVDFSREDDCDWSCDGVRTKTRVRNPRKTRVLQQNQPSAAESTASARRHARLDVLE